MKLETMIIKELRKIDEYNHEYLERDIRKAIRIAIKRKRMQT
jgi:hypothetical protein